MHTSYETFPHVIDLRHLRLGPPAPGGIVWCRTCRRIMLQILGFCRWKIEVSSPGIRTNSRKIIQTNRFRGTRCGLLQAAAVNNDALHRLSGAHYQHRGGAFPARMEANSPAGQVPLWLTGHTTNTVAEQRQCTMPRPRQWCSSRGS